MGDSYRDWRLEDFLTNFSGITSVEIEHGKKIPPYFYNPAHYQTEVVKKAVSDIPFFLSSGSGTGTVNSIMLQLIYQSEVKSNPFHLAQCYLALSPAVFGPESIILPVDAFNYTTHKNQFYTALKKSGQKEPALFSDFERTYSDLYAIASAWKLKRHYTLDFEPGNTKAQLSSIVRCAKGEQEFLSVFYKYIVSPALRIE